MPHGLLCLLLKCAVYHLIHNTVLYWNHLKWKRGRKIFRLSATRINNHDEEISCGISSCFCLHRISKWVLFLCIIHAESVFQALFCPHLCYLKSFIHLMLCNYYIISVMIMLYYVTILEMQFIAIYDND